MEGLLLLRLMVNVFLLVRQVGAMGVLRLVSKARYLFCPLNPYYRRLTSMEFMAGFLGTETGLNPR